MEMISESQGKRPSRGVLICPDISPFKSVVDGSVITGRRALREHNKRNDVTFADDFKGEWADKRKTRDSMYGGDSKFDQKRRVEAIKNAVEQHTRRR
jgi:hypothetical protein